MPADPRSDEMETRLVDDLVARARKAQKAYEHGATQDRYDKSALAAAWALMEPGRNQELAGMAVETTGLGNEGRWLAHENYDPC